VLRGIDRVRAALVYEFPVDGLVAGAKFRGRLECAHALGDLLAWTLAGSGAPRPGCDLVVPVPLHPARLGRRGYNQAAIIGAAAARATGALLDTGACLRLRNTLAQSGLAGRARRANVRGAFKVRRQLTGLTIAVVDDVVTTGHTVSALAVALRRAGAIRIEVWSAARVLTGQGARKM
jgi:ComF family protein